MTKYCTQSSYGKVDNKTTLELTDDAAHVNWGGSWRMPTKAELEELCTKCTWTITDLDGVKGYRVISKTNGNSIFLPAAGVHLKGSSDYANVSGFYWSSSLSDYSSNLSYILSFYPSSGGDAYSFTNRYYGLPVRAVCP